MSLCIIQRMNIQELLYAVLNISILFYGYNNEIIISKWDQFYASKNKFMPNCHWTVIRGTAYLILCISKP